MIRNLRFLGLALMAVVAVSAMVASAASAQTGTLTTDGPVTQTAVATGAGNVNALTAFGLTLVCPGTTFTGHKYNQTPHTFIPSGSTTATVTPLFAQPQCKVSGIEWPATVDMNGCDFVIHFGLTTGGVDTYGITFDVDCPIGNEITVTIWTTAASHASEPPICIIHLGETGNQGLTGLHLTDTTNGHFDITGTLAGLDMTRTKSNTHPLLCSESTTSTASFDFDDTISGHNALGEPTAMGASHP